MSSASSDGEGDATGALADSSKKQKTNQGTPSTFVSTPAGSAAGTLSTSPAMSAFSPHPGNSASVKAAKSTKVGSAAELNGPAKATTTDTAHGATSASAAATTAGATLKLTPANHTHLIEKLIEMETRRQQAEEKRMELMVNSTALEERRQEIHLLTLKLLMDLQNSLLASMNYLAQP